MHLAVTDIMPKLNHLHKSSEGRLHGPCLPMQHLLSLRDRTGFNMAAHFQDGRIVDVPRPKIMDVQSNEEMHLWTYPLNHYFCSKREFMRMFL